MPTRRPLWPLLTAALVGLPVLYILSFGPACWVASEPFVPCAWNSNRGMIVYAPLARIAAEKKCPIGAALRWWAGVWLGPTDIVKVPLNAAGTHVKLVGHFR